MNVDEPQVISLHEKRFRHDVFHAYKILRTGRGPQLASDGCPEIGLDRDRMFLRDLGKAARYPTACLFSTLLTSDLNFFFPTCVRGCGRCWGAMSVRSEDAMLI
jgi:hypothetical protein